ncbi:nitroreductase family protein [Caviibacter abscessus]|uniref:nitroreductase family protein n=1 Tax=Caviibacter abscessus TaxID=1766719 RepID=UPI00082B9CB6|nr:nitroreductase family protein [Caviibacter abscessus]
MDILEAIKNRKSIRQFTGEHVKEEDLKAILELASRAPSSVNGQQVSLVYTTDKEKIAKIAELAGGQAQVKNSDVFITIIGDFYRASTYLDSKGLSLKDNESELKNIASVDAGIMVYLLNMAAMAYGYGSTIIGGIKQASKEISELLELPEHTYVMVGITLGVPTKESLEGTLKPRICSKAFAMKDKYDREAQKNAISEYEVKLDEWFKSIGVSQPLFGDVIKRFYSK